MAFHPNASKPAAKITISTANRLFANQILKPQELLLYCYNIAEQTQSQFNVFSHLFPLHQDGDGSLTDLVGAASESEQRWKEGTQKGPLDGIPISIKSNIAIKGKPFHANSNILHQDDSNGGSSSSLMGYDSHVVQRLKANGAIIIGMTNMDEFGMGSLGHYCNNGSTINPVPFFMNNYSTSATATKNNSSTIATMSDEQWMSRIKSLYVPELHGWTQEQDQYLLSPGGSSSGSAVSVALNSSLASIGTDTGGSIRLPAAWCGVVGMKPSYGSISRRGVISYASSLDTVGILANSVPCVQSVFDALKNKRGEKEQEQHYDIEEIGDATSSSHYHCVKNSSSSSSSSANIEQKENHVVESLSNIRIGIPEAFVIEECHPQIMKAWEQAIHNLECKHNATIQIISQKKISQTNVKLSLPAYYVISSAEASSNLARYDGMKFGSKTKKMEDCGDMNSDKDNETDLLAAREKQISLNRGSLFGAEVKRRILAGTAVLSSDRFHSFYEGASRVRAAITSQLNQAFRKNKKKMTTSDDNNDDDGVDFMIVPTALAHPPSLSSSDAHSMDNTEIFLNDVMTTPVSLAGLPSVSIPIWDDCSEQEQGIHTRSHPVSGIQIVGPKNSEEELLRVSSILQSGLST